MSDTAAILTPKPQPKRVGLNDRVRQDIFFRLRWDVLSPYPTHPLAEESIAKPPLSRIDSVWIGNCLDKKSYDDIPEGYRYDPPPALCINNEDGRPITFGQFVSETHAYFNEERNLAELKRAKGEMYGEVIVREDGSRGRIFTYGKAYLPPNIALFVSRVHSVLVGDDVWFSVNVYAEGEGDWTMERFWQLQGRNGWALEEIRAGRKVPVRQGLVPDQTGVFHTRDGVVVSGVEARTETVMEVHVRG